MRQLLTFILCTVLFSSAYCQERVDEKLPKIAKAIATINQAVGWRKNDVGKWVSMKKAIPYAYHDMLSAEESFLEYKLYRIKIEDNEYTTLVETKQLGFEFWVFENDQVFEKQDSSFFIGKPVLVSGGGYRFSELSLVTEIKASLKKQENDGGSLNETLNICVNYLPSKKMFRFHFSKGLYYNEEEGNPCDTKYYETSELQFAAFYKEL